MWVLPVRSTPSRRYPAPRYVRCGSIREMPRALPDGALAHRAAGVASESGAKRRVGQMAPEPRYKISSILANPASHLPICLPEEEEPPARRGPFPTRRCAYVRMGLGSRAKAHSFPPDA